MDEALGDSLRHRVERRAGTTWIALRGKITERANFTALMALPGPLTIDLGEITAINSLGVREWILFVRDREAAGVDLAFERCSPVIVSQIGMIRHFMGAHSRLVSVLTPYLCPSCNHEALEVLGLTPGTEVNVPLTMPCPKCRAAMDLDELAETYAQLGNP